MLRKTKKNKVIGAVVLILIAIVGFFVSTRTPEVPMPENTINLDLSKTEDRGYLATEKYRETMDTVVVPYLQAREAEGTLTAEDGITLYYKTYQQEDAKGGIVISHGFTENMDKYREVSYYFLNQGYSVYIMDHRGHGYSEREVSDLSMVHVESFQDYVDDFKLFVDTVAKRENADKPLFIFAHSMGGGIAAAYLEQNPQDITAAVLSAPMMEIQTGDYPAWTSHLIAKFYRFVGRGDTYIWGSGPFNGEFDANTSSALDVERGYYYFTLRNSDEMLQATGGSFTWLDSCLKGTKQIIDHAKDAVTPILLFHPENDDLVGANGHYRFAADAPNTQMIYVAESRHEVFNTPKEIMVPYYNTIFEFFEHYLW